MNPRLVERMGGWGRTDKSAGVYDMMLRGLFYFAPRLVARRV